VCVGAGFIRMENIPMPPGLCQAAIILTEEGPNLPLLKFEILRLRCAPAQNDSPACSGSE